MTASTPPPDRPHGRTEVVAALLDAATKLFAERGPAAVSLRDVAQEANVNLGLIHRYIGSKHDLLAAVLAARPGFPVPESRDLDTPEHVADLVLELITSDTAYARIVLRASLDGFDVARLQGTFPLLDRTARAVRNSVPRRDADARVALIASAALGWQAVGGLMLDVLQLRRLPHDEIEDALRPAIVAFLRAGA